jgi:hypothetical protein
MAISLITHFYLNIFNQVFDPNTQLYLLCDDLLKNMDNGELNCVVFLHVRKAFDSINHEILLDKMHNFFGIKGTQLKWFESCIFE